MKRQDNKLKKLANFLDTKVRARPAHLFDMDQWISGRFKNRAMNCSTAACAFGYATVLWPKSLKVSLNKGTRPAVTYKRYGGMTAVCEFFGLTLDEANYIFSATGYAYQPITIDMVIEHIHEVVESKGNIRWYSAILR